MNSRAPVVAGWRKALTRHALAGALAVCGACESTPQARLAGEWVGVEMEVIGGQVSAQKAGWARGTALRFGNGTVRVTVPEHPPEISRYTVRRQRDGVMTLSLQSPHGEPKQAQFTLETDELLRWHLTDEHTLVLQRR